MSKKKPLVVVTRKLPAVVETRMRELFDAQLNLDDKPMSQAQRREAVKTADVLVPTVPTVSTPASSPRPATSSGSSPISATASTTSTSPAPSKRGITVTNTPGVLTDDTAT